MFKCDRLTQNYQTDKATCASCREVLKIDIVRLLLELDPIYLSEGNRNKKGRPPMLTATEQSDVISAYKNGKIMENLSKEYNVSKTTIYNFVHKYHLLRN